MSRLNTMPSIYHLVKAIVFLQLLALFSAGKSSSSLNCLNVEIADLMGDGWNNAALIVSTVSNGKLISEDNYSIGPDDINSYKNLNLCVDDNSESVITLHLTNVLPDEVVECPWEITWNVKGNDGRIYQVGSFNTSMTFIYAPHSWNMISATNLARSTFSCAVQIGSLQQSCISPVVSILTNEIFLVDNDKDPHRLEIPEDTGVAMAEVQLQTYDSRSEGWFESNGKGTTWYITDESRSIALAVGAMDSGETMHRIILKLPEGSYYLRVTGAFDTSAKDHYWYFCGVYGTTGDELSFFIENGECLASQHYSASVLKSGRIRTTLQIHGAMSVTGPSTELAIDSSVLSELKDTLIQGTSSPFLPKSSFQITAFSYGKGRETLAMAVALPRRRRYLMNEILAVEFTVSLILEDFQIDGTNKFKLSSFADKILSDIHNFIDSGDYFTTLSKQAYKLNNNFLMTLTGITLTELKISEVAYSLASSSYFEQDRNPISASSFSSVQSYAIHIVFDYAIIFGFLSVSAIILITLISFISFAQSRRTLDDSDDEEDSNNDDDPEEEHFIDEDIFFRKMAHRSLQQLDTDTLNSDERDEDIISTSSKPNDSPSRKVIKPMVPPSAASPASLTNSAHDGSLSASIKPLLPPPPSQSLGLVTPLEPLESNKFLSTAKSNQSQKVEVMSEKVVVEGVSSPNDAINIADHIAKNSTSAPLFVSTEKTEAVSPNQSSTTTNPSQGVHGSRNGSSSSTSVNTAAGRKGPPDSFSNIRRKLKPITPLPAPPSDATVTGSPSPTDDELSKKISSSSLIDTLVTSANRTSSSPLPANLNNVTANTSSQDPLRQSSNTMNSTTTSMQLELNISSSQSTSIPEQSNNSIRPSSSGAGKGSRSGHLAIAMSPPFRS